MADSLAQSLSAYLDDPTQRLPPLRDLEEAARNIAVLLERHGGATFSLHFGDMAGQNLYAVSLFPERSVVEPGRMPDALVIKRFIDDNLDLLSDPRCSVGVWFSSALGLTYLDVSATLPAKEGAVALGMRYNQEAVYDLVAGEVIDTGGTGTSREGLPPEAERLPPQAEG